MQPEKRTVILISVGVVMAILIIIAAVLLMKGRGGGGKYEEYYSQAMEYYIDGDFENAAASAKKAKDHANKKSLVCNFKDLFLIAKGIKLCYRRHKHYRSRCSKCGWKKDQRKCHSCKHSVGLQRI